MYPSLDVSTPAASLAATAGSTAGAGGGSLGGATTSFSGDGPLFPLLRVQISSKLRVAPQVRKRFVSSFKRASSCSERSREKQRESKRVSMRLLVASGTVQSIDDSPSQPRSFPFLSPPRTTPSTRS